MNIPSDLGAKIGENNAVPTTGVTDANVKQIGAVAEWYVRQERHYSDLAGC
jgi:sulfonate transport system substrate-binding protein